MEILDCRPIIFIHKMTNALVQELCKHIARLESENERLEVTLAKHHAVFRQLTETAGFESWSSFVDWTLAYFSQPSNKLVSEMATSSNSRSCSI